jgi:hypothetical protein
MESLFENMELATEKLIAELQDKSEGNDPANILALLMLSKFDSTYNITISEPTKPGELPPCIQYHEIVYRPTWLPGTSRPTQAAREYKVDTKRIPTDESIRGVTQLSPSVCKAMTHALCDSCVLRNFAFKRRGGLNANGKRVLDRRRSTVELNSSTIITDPTPKTPIADVIGKNPYAKCERPIDYVWKILYDLEPISLFGTLAHKIDSRNALNALREKGIVLPQRLFEGQADLYSTQSRIRKALSRTTIGEYRIQTCNLPGQFEEKCDPETQKVSRSIPWRNYAESTEPNAYSTLVTRMQEIDTQFEARMNQTMATLNIHEYYTFPEINLRKTEKGDIVEFVRQHKATIMDHISQKTPRTQTAFYHVFKHESTNYATLLTGIPDNIIFGKNNNSDCNFPQLMQDFANIVYGEDKNNNLFDPSLYERHPEYIETLKSLSQEINAGNIKLIVEETKVGNKMRFEDAANDSAHYLLGIFCLLSAFDNNLTLDKLIQNSAFVCDTRELKLIGENLMAILENGASINFETTVVESSQIQKSLNKQISNIALRAAHPTDFNKI